MAVTQYIGSRYVPLFADPAEWSSAKTYEPLTIVLHQGNSYTSKQFVPKGIAIDNDAYWAETGNYNAQVEQYRSEVMALVDDVSNIKDIIPTDAFVDTTVKAYIDSAIETIEESNYSGNSFDVMYDGYNTDISCFVTALRLSRNKYAMNKFIPYSTMTDALNYKDIMSTYENTVFCAPNLPADYLIRNGVATGVSYAEVWCLLCTYADNSYSIEEVYAPSSEINTASLISRGVVNALIVWEPIVRGGYTYPASLVPDSMVNKEYIIDGIHTRFIIGWDSNYTYLISVNGRIPFSAGCNHLQLVELINSLGIPNAINCDGGGSTQMWLCPSGTNLCYSRNVESTQQKFPGNSRPKPLTGFSPIE